MTKTLKHFRLSDETLKRITEINKHLGLNNETAALEVAVKTAHDKLLGVNPHAQPTANSYTETIEYNED